MQLVDDIESGKAFHEDNENMKATITDMAKMAGIGVFRIRQSKENGNTKLS
jgi:hypothetical protein